MNHSVPSRKKFEQYKADFQTKDGQSKGTRGSRDAKKRRDRSALQLIRCFLEMIRGHRGSVALSLATLTAATLLALIPPAATKFVVDNVLGGKPLPSAFPAWVPREPWPLLLLITAAVIGISLIKIALHIWGRWHATRVTKMIQMSLRRRLINHAIRLPLHRIQELKSGGAASILRQDAGSVGDLIFGMLYNPWRAVIQLAACVFWRGSIGDFC